MWALATLVRLATNLRVSLEPGYGHTLARSFGDGEKRLVVDTTGPELTDGFKDGNEGVWQY